MKIVEYSTPGCISCRMMRQTLEMLQKAHPDITVEYRDITELKSSEPGEKLPILEVYQGDKLIKRLNGVCTKVALEKQLEEEKC